MLFLKISPVLVSSSPHQPKTAWDCAFPFLWYQTAYQNFLEASQKSSSVATSNSGKGKTLAFLQRFGTRTLAIQYVNLSPINQGRSASPSMCRSTTKNQYTVLRINTPAAAAAATTRGQIRKVTDVILLHWCKCVWRHLVSVTLWWSCVITENEQKHNVFTWQKRLYFLELTSYLKFMKSKVVL